MTDGETEISVLETLRCLSAKSEITPFPIINVRKNVHILNMIYMELKSEITAE